MFASAVSACVALEWPGAPAAYDPHSKADPTVTNDTLDTFGPIDAVITWVDGNVAGHRRQRDRHIALARTPLHENAINPHRWASNDEILYCVRSIQTHAPWMRWIWIVVDGHRPDLSSLGPDVRAKVRFAVHDEIFGEFADVLPTFNSLAIESLLWRIEGLAERFLYFNDDVFLTAPLLPGDVFRGLSPVLRGRWVDYGAMAGDFAKRSDPAWFNHYMQINAATLMGFGAKRLFAAAHVVHPMRRSVMSDLFARMPDAFAANVGHRFRDLAQFLPQGLHNHACIASGEAVIETRTDHLHIRSGQAAEAARISLSGMAQAGVRFLCVNDLPQLEAVLPEARGWIDAAVGAGRAGLAADHGLAHRGHGGDVVIAGATGARRASS
ncbi:MAG: hypothetical protein WBA67_15885 [Jannaschia sp.]